jgi:hypothetical protein
MRAYTYLIKHKPTGQVYYGFRSANTVAPEEDLWKRYFTSSKRVQQLVEDFGAESFDVEVRRTFDSQEQAVNWETKVLRRCKVLEDTRWLNQNILGYIVPTEESRKKISEANKGRIQTEDEKLQRSLSQKGSKRPWSAQNLPKDVSGANNGMYGKTQSEETRRKIGEKNRGKTPPNKGVPMSEEQKAKLREKMLGRKVDPEVVARRAEKQRGQKREKRHCPHCDKDIAVGWYNRHGDNCKHAPRS